MKAESVGPVKAASINIPNIARNGKVKGMNCNPFLASTTGNRGSQVPANAMTK
jgi:hypothetical protein